MVVTGEDEADDESWMMAAAEALLAELTLRRGVRGELLERKASPRAAARGLILARASLRELLAPEASVEVVGARKGTLGPVGVTRTLDDDGPATG